MAVCEKGEGAQNSEGWHRGGDRRDHCRSGLGGLGGGAPDLAAEEALEGTLKKYPFTHVLHTEHRESEYCTLL